MPWRCICLHKMPPAHTGSTHLAGNQLLLGQRGHAPVEDGVREEACNTSRHGHLQGIPRGTSLKHEDLLRGVCAQLVCKHTARGSCGYVVSALLNDTNVWKEYRSPCQWLSTPAHE